MRFAQNVNSRITHVIIPGYKMFTFCGLNTVNNPIKILFHNEKPGPICKKCQKSLVTYHPLPGFGEEDGKIRVRDYIIIPKLENNEVYQVTGIEDSIVLTLNNKFHEFISDCVKVPKDRYDKIQIVEKKILDMFTYDNILEENLIKESNESGEQ